MGWSKTPIDKFKTKLKKIVSGKLKLKNKVISIDNTPLLKYTDHSVEYTEYRYYSSKVEPLVKEDFRVTILLEHETLKYISQNSPNPPPFSKSLIKIFRENHGSIDKLIIGSNKNSIQGATVNITFQLYDDFARFNSEEGKDRSVRFKKRLMPSIKKYYNVTIKGITADRDYGLLLREIIDSGTIDQQDLRELSEKLNPGSENEIVIKTQVNKQASWLIDTIEKILEIDNIDKSSAQNFGKTHFGFSKSSISGPEDLMEKILTKYGQFTLFGVPALINTDKYVQTDRDLPRCQFDLILVTHLGDIEVVELKGPDQIILDYDKSRNKFYPSTDLSVAIAQAERYITSVIKDNDDEFKIDGKKIRTFINEKVGSTLFIETIRPSAIILIGSYKSICRPYSKLDSKTKGLIKKKAYDENSIRAYRELRAAFKNIVIMTYSELLEHARTRLHSS